MNNMEIFTNMVNEADKIVITFFKDWSLSVIDQAARINDSLTNMKKKETVIKTRREKLTDDIAEIHKNGGSAQEVMKVIHKYNEEVRRLLDNK